MKTNKSSVSSKNNIWFRAPRLDTYFIADLFSQQLMQLPMERRK